jgi:hypothetical protein
MIRAFETALGWGVVVLGILTAKQCTVASLEDQQ